MTFNVSAIAPAAYNKACWYCFKGMSILVAENGGRTEIPFFTEPSAYGIKTSRAVYIGTNGSNHCFCAEITSDTPVKGFALISLRQIYTLISSDEFSIASRALQIVNWDLTHRFCGRCGSPMQTHTQEFAKICPSCNLTLYPRISPAIIVAIVKEGKILLARRVNSEMFSVIAGYVEAGETLEETVARETQEEVGITVKNIRYFSSQPWAFSYSLMLAFTAEYESGSIVPDGVEIEEANWYSPDSLPEMIPGPISVARNLINWFKTTYS